MNSVELLESYHRAGAEEAFAEVMRRHGGLVFGTARRRLSDARLAEEVTQAVFARLARSSPRFVHEAELIAWLHHTTLHVAIDTWRSESRRRHREQAVALMEPPSRDESPWEEVAPVLDATLDELKSDDRQLLLSRYFQARTMRDLGALFGISEDAAKMRVSRAVERLRALLVRRGIACSIGGLVAFLEERHADALPSEVCLRLSSSLAEVRQAVAPDPSAWRQFLASKGGRLLIGTAGLAGLVMVLSGLIKNPGNDTETASRPAMETSAGATQNEEATQGGVRDTFRRARWMAPEGPLPVRRTLEVLDDATGAGIAGARVDAPTFFAGGEMEAQSLVTDGEGRVEIRAARRPDADRGMNIFVTAEGYVPKVISCSATSAAGQRTVRLDPARVIGGRVVDEEGRPVASARIRIEHHEEPNAAGESPAFHHRAAEVTSGTDGGWRCPFVPTKLTTVRLEISHADYATTLAEVASQGEAPADAVLVLRSGYTVAGLITDEGGQPVAGAEVREFHNTGHPRRSTRSGGDGRYTLTGLWITWAREGTLDVPPQALLVVDAAGFAPQNRVVDLKPATVTWDLRLGVGKRFHGRVLDEAGRPIAGAVIRTDSDSDGLRPYIWSTRTDSNGKFEWSTAPAEPILFWFEADGFKWQRDMLLEPSEKPNEIRLAR